jgi:hypothetical protein
MRRLFATTAAGLLAVGLLAGCSSGDSAEEIVERASDGKVDIDDDGKKVTIQGEDGEGTFSVGEDTELPDDFPEGEVPLPEGGSVRAAISTERDGKQMFSITYAIDGADVKGAARDYRTQLEDDGYEVEESASFGGTDGGFTSFTAIGPDWDVRVFSAGSSSADDAALSIQVSTHEAT